MLHTRTELSHTRTARKTASDTRIAQAGTRIAQAGTRTAQSHTRITRGLLFCLIFHPSGHIRMLRVLGRSIRVSYKAIRVWTAGSPKIDFFFHFLARAQFRI